MVYIRGQRQDYDSWAQMGCRSWSYDKVLPVFRDLENNQRLSGEFHGAAGPNCAFPIAATAIPCHGRSFAPPKKSDCPTTKTSTARNRRAWGSIKPRRPTADAGVAAQAFLRPAEKRRNLTIMTGTRVHKVIFEGKRATGVLLESGRTISAAKEIVITAGAIASPKLLQLSGIGDAAHLKSHGIEVVADLPGVGENYHDHLEATVQAEVKDPISMFGEDKGLKAAGHMLQYLLTKTGLLTSTVVESGGFVDTAGTGQPDLQFHVLPTFVGFAERLPEPGHGISIGPCFLHPQSRGTVKLRSADPKDSALFNANALSAPADVETLVRGVELAIKITEAPSLARLIKRRVLPKPGVEKDREALRDYVRSVAKTVFHPSGTCKMGRADDRMAVVGEDLKVHGVDGLRVADASIMPTLVSGNTNAPTIMIGERASRFILGKDHAA